MELFRFQSCKVKGSSHFQTPQCLKPEHSMLFPLCYNPCSCIQVIIRHEVGVPGLRKALILLFFLLPASLVWLSCGGSSSSSTQEPAVSNTAPLSPITSQPVPGRCVYRRCGKRSRGPLLPDFRRQYSGNDGGHAQPGPDPGLQRQRHAILRQPVHHHQQRQRIRCLSPDLAWHDRELRRFAGQLHRLCCRAHRPVVGQSPGAIGVIDLKTGAVTAAISCPPVNPTNPVCVWPGTGLEVSTSLTVSLHGKYRQSDPGFQPGRGFRREYGGGDHAVECGNAVSRYHFRARL